MKNTAILLSAGKGMRLREETGGMKKQYTDLAGIPMISYSLRTLLESPEITELVMVIAKEDRPFVEEEVLPGIRKGVGEENFTKFKGFAYGGKERYHSVYNGLTAIDWQCDYVFIHDGARPFIEEDTIQRLLAAAGEEEAVVAGMPSKDTVKIVDAGGYVAQTPDRSLVWTIQTPQVFECALITDAYRKMIREEESLRAKGVNITDDAMAVELMCSHRVKLVEASYRNFKVTTPEDLESAWPIAMEFQERWNPEMLEISWS